MSIVFSFEIGDKIVRLKYIIFRVVYIKRDNAAEKDTTGITEGRFSILSIILLSLKDGLNYTAPFLSLGEDEEGIHS